MIDVYFKSYIVLSYLAVFLTVNGDGNVNPSASASPVSEEEAAIGDADTAQQYESVTAEDLDGLREVYAQIWDWTFTNNEDAIFR